MPITFPFLSIFYLFYRHIWVLWGKVRAKRNSEKNDCYSPLTFSDHIQCTVLPFYIVFHLFSRILSHFRIIFVTDRSIFEYVRCRKTFRSFCADVVQARSITCVEIRGSGTKKFVNCYATIIETDD